MKERVITAKIIAEFKKYLVLGKEVWQRLRNISAM